MNKSSRFIGLMSGTSLDGVDAVLLSFAADGTMQLEYQYYQPFTATLQSTLLALNQAGTNEIERSQLAALELAAIYADSVKALLALSPYTATDICAIGCHGQTIRHRPELGFSVQIGNAAWLAERTGMTVITDFRNRDIAAGGQGAPLVPAFHAALFGTPHQHRAIINIGGISNISYLPAQGIATGFDCGPGNLLMDGWIQRHRQQPYDENGRWAQSGKVLPELLHALLAHPFFNQSPPKSTGRDTFHLAWLEQYLMAGLSPTDVQATLLECSAHAIAIALRQHCPDTTEIYLCGGGARNQALIARLETLCPRQPIFTTARLGLPIDAVESAAFAWLARQTLLAAPGNLPAVTGASGPRILGAIYPA